MDMSFVRWASIQLTTVCSLAPAKFTSVPHPYKTHLPHPNIPPKSQPITTSTLSSKSHQNIINSKVINLIIKLSESETSETLSINHPGAKLFSIWGLVKQLSASKIQQWDRHGIYTLIPKQRNLKEQRGCTSQESMKSSRANFFRF